MQMIHVSKENRSLVVPATAAVTFPEAPKLDGNWIVLPHGLAETMLLRNQGYAVQNPMGLYYDYRGGTPYDVQRRTCDLLSSSTRAYCLNDLGTGKTRSVLWAWDWLNQNNWAHKMLVVCPISTMNFVWAAEVFATMPDRKVSVLYGSKAKRLEALAEDADIYVINHDGLRVIADAIAARKDIDVLAIDELAVYRNNSDRSKLMRKFAEHFTWVWGMTGRPMPNAPTDVWSQCKIITPNSVPKYFRVAQQQLMLNVDGGRGWRWVPRPDAVQQAFNMMQPAVRFSLDDVVELPDVVYRTIDVDMSAEQTRVYKKMAKEFKAMVDEKAITAANAAAAMTKLLQVSVGRVYTVAPEFVALDAEPRRNALMDIINDAAQKVLVFVPYRHVLEELSELFTGQGVNHCVVDGDTPSKERDDLFNRFQNTGEFDVLLAHPQCLAHGVTLTAADTIVWYGPMASLEIYEQANARIRRVGQKHRQQILHLQSTPVEKRIYALLQAKQKVQDKLLEMFELATESTR